MITAKLIVVPRITRSCKRLRRDIGLASRLARASVAVPAAPSAVDVIAGGAPVSASSPRSNAIFP